MAMSVHLYNNHVTFYEAVKMRAPAIHITLAKLVEVCNKTDQK